LDPAGRAEPGTRHGPPARATRPRRRHGGPACRSGRADSAARPDADLQRAGLPGGTAINSYSGQHLRDPGDGRHVQRHRHGPGTPRGHAVHLVSGRTVTSAAGAAAARQPGPQPATTAPDPGASFPASAPTTGNTAPVVEGVLRPPVAGGRPGLQPVHCQWASTGRRPTPPHPDPDVYRRHQWTTISQHEGTGGTRRLKHVPARPLHPHGRHRPRQTSSATTVGVQRFGNGGGTGTCGTANVALKDGHASSTRTPASPPRRGGRKTPAPAASTVSPTQGGRSISLPQPICQVDPGLGGGLRHRIPVQTSTAPATNWTTTDHHDRHRRRAGTPQRSGTGRYIRM